MIRPIRTSSKKAAIKERGKQNKTKQRLQRIEKNLAAPINACCRPLRCLLGHFFSLSVSLFLWRSAFGELSQPVVVAAAAVRRWFNCELDTSDSSAGLKNNGGGSRGD